MKRNSSYPEGPRRVGASLTIPFVIELFNPDAYLYVHDVMHYYYYFDVLCCLLFPVGIYTSCAFKCCTRA